MGNFFSGLAQTAVRAAPFAAQVVAQRNAKEKADMAAALAQLHQQSQDNTAMINTQTQAGVSLANIGHLNAETEALRNPAPKPAEYDIKETDQGIIRIPKIGPAGAITGPDGKPLAKIATPRNLDPLSPEGIKASADRAGAVAGAEAPFKKDPNAGPAPRAPSEFNQRAALLYPRAADAAKRLDQFFEKGAPIKAGAGKIPIVGNYVLSPDEQVMNQAAETVASAILRIESGAAISESEVKSYAKQFLPQPGDSPEVRADKRQTLQTQLERLHAAASPVLGDAPPVAPTGRGRGGPPPNVPHPANTGDPGGNVDLSTHVQTIDEMIKAGKSDAEIKAALGGSVATPAVPKPAAAGGRSLPRGSSTP